MNSNQEHTEMAATMPADTPCILVVEDESVFARAIARRLEREGYDCVTVGSLGDAEAALKVRFPDLVLLDMRLPDGSGLDFLQRLRNGSGSTLPVIAMTAYGEVDDAVSAMKLSASDYLKKPFDLDELLLAIVKVIANNEVSTRLAYSHAREANTNDVVPIIGESRSIEQLREHIQKIAKLCSATSLPPPTVLISGATGTGKDVTARMLHWQSARRNKPFVHIDCASLPKDLIESELFGHLKGAFTGAYAERTGLIEMAEDGVVFLDEVGELPSALQAKLLAVLERRMLRRVGGSREIPVRAWFIAATNRNIKAMLEDGALRSDLYFRLNVLSLDLPLLSERREDIVALSESFGQQIARRHGIANFQLTDAALLQLRSYHWPGNVRELRHVIERATLLSGDGNVGVEGLMLSSVEQAPGHTALSGLTLDAAERLLIIDALIHCENNVSAASRRLGISRMAMRYRMQRHNIT